MQAQAQTLQQPQSIDRRLHSVTSRAPQVKRAFLISLVGGRSLDNATTSRQQATFRDDEENSVYVKGYN